MVKTKQLFAKTPLSNFPLKECLFGATNIAKDSDKMMYLCSGYGITFDGQVRKVLLMTLLGML